MPDPHGRFRDPLRTTRFGLAPDGEGWFVVNAAESRWRKGLVYLREPAALARGAGVTQETTRPRRRVPAVSPPGTLRLSPGLAAPGLDTREPL